jgi:drug/metabolite transporter (DMT)-like permease
VTVIAEKSWTRAQADLALVVAALFFGGTFLVVKDGVEQADPIPFVGLRYVIAAAVLWPFARSRPATPGVWRDGALAGAFLGVGYLFQTAGLQYTTSSTSAFITYLLVVFVPLLSAVVLRHLPHGLTWVGLVMAVSGLVLLTGGAGTGFGKGEWLTLGCAVAFAAHILVIARVATRHDVLRLTVVQITVIAAGCGVLGLFTGGYRFAGSAWAAAAATGVGATAIAFVLQVGAQRTVGPTRTAIMLLLEPVFAAVFGRLTGEQLGWQGVLGGALILAAVLVTEVIPNVLTGRSSLREPDD